MGFSYQKNFFNPTLPVDEAQFWALVKATNWNEAIDKFRETGDQKLKRGLPAFIFQATFDETESKKGIVGAWRKQSATRLTGLVVMDVDHVDNPRGLVDGKLKIENGKLVAREEWAAAKNCPLSILNSQLEQILLIYVTPSGHGLKIVFKADVKKGNLIDNQHAMAEVLGVEVDESCKDASRMSFICKESDILFINKELFTYENKEFSDKYEPEYRAGRSGSRLSAGSNTAGTDPLRLTSQTQLGQSPDVRQTQNFQSSIFNLQSLKWRGYDIQSIIDQRYADKLPCEADSNRHAESLKLATDLMLMLDSDKQRVLRIVEAQPWVQEIIKSRNENVGQTVESAASCVARKEHEYASSLPSKSMLEAIRKVTGKSYQEITKTQEKKEATTLSEDEINTRLWNWGEQIEQLSEHYPLLKDICKGLKKNQYPAALVVGGGMMMTLMTRCTYRFYHRPEELRRLNCSALVIGDPASGKSFATRLYKLLMTPVFESDKIGKDAINAYREEMRTKGANKEKPKKPKVVIQIHPSRTSNAQFTQDMINAVVMIDGVKMHLHMFTFDTELDNTLAIQKGGSWIDKQSLELKAFRNEEDGVAYSNNDSIFQDFNVYWNFVYTGTPIALKKKVNEQNFGSGLATRLTCVPLPATNFQMLSREPQVDIESDERLKEWAYKLDKTKGELPVQKLVDELYDWTERRMLDAQENESKADEMLLKRCAYHGLNFAAPFIVMRHWDKMKKDGDYWTCEFETDEVDWQLAELIVNMQYACQRHYFGAMAEAYFDNKNREIATNVRHRQKTIEAFGRLPEEFVIEDVMKCFSVSNTAASSKIFRMIKDRYVEKSGDYVENGKAKAKYKKTGVIMI